MASGENCTIIYKRSDVSVATIPLYTHNKAWFDHIRGDHGIWDGRCPLQEINSPGVIDPDDGSMSWLLAQVLEHPSLAGTRDIVTNRRLLRLMVDSVNTGEGGLLKYFSGGSVGDGFCMNEGDVDTMLIDTRTIVTYPDQYRLLHKNSRYDTVLLMREADCQLGYVALELGSSELSESLILSSVVPIGDSMFISSDKYRQGWVDMFGDAGFDHVPHGPCSTLTVGDLQSDIALSFPCTCWPKEAEEWVHRTRLYGWPPQDLRDKIIKNGCHLVPVGDRCSPDPALQWRISFLTAERRLVHSLSHQQFRIYGLLKYFLKQLTELLEDIIGDGDILCSYYMKTLIFHAVENSPSTLWQHKHTFVCFRFCLRILMEWIKNGNCPNYFIKNNNLFKRKVHGEHQQKLLHILTDMYHMKWSSLSLGTVYQPSIGKLLHQTLHVQLSPVLRSRDEREFLRDMDIFGRLHESEINNARLTSPLRLLSESQSDTGEFIAYNLTAVTLYNMARAKMSDHTTPGGNKQKYRDLRKCKRLLTPRAALGTGVLHLATIHYCTGNYRKSLEMCADLIRPRCYIGDGTEYRDEDRYQRLYCGRGYSLYHKQKEGCASPVSFYKKNVSFCLPHIHLELIKHPLCLCIPPLPYAVFLSFLCYHDLGDTSRRDAALLHLRAVNYDPEQGGHKHWIVHTLLGICYQTVGDNRRAFQAYTDSLQVMPIMNPALERIEALRCSD